MKFSRLPLLLFAVMITAVAMAQPLFRKYLACLLQHDQLELDLKKLPGFTDLPGCNLSSV